MAITYNEEGRIELAEILNSMDFNTLFTQGDFNDDEKEFIGRNFGEGFLWINKVSGTLDAPKKGEAPTQKEIRTALKVDLDLMLESFLELQKFAYSKKNYHGSEDDHTSGKLKAFSETLTPGNVEKIQKQLDNYNASTGYKYISTPQMKALYTMVRGLGSTASRLNDLAEFDELKKTKDELKKNSDDFAEKYKELENSAKEKNICLAKVEQYHSELLSKIATITEDIKDYTKKLNFYKKMLKELTNSEPDQVNNKTEETSKKITLIKDIINSLDTLVICEKKRLEADIERSKNPDMVKITKQCKQLRKKYEDIRNSLDTLNDLNTYVTAEANSKLKAMVTDRINYFLSKINRGTRLLHINSDEFKAMRDRMNDYLKGKCDLAAINQAATGYLSAKKKGISANSDMRNIRLAFAKELRDFTCDCIRSQEYIENKSEDINEVAKISAFKGTYDSKLTNSRTEPSSNFRYNCFKKAESYLEAINKCRDSYNKTKAALIQLERKKGPVQKKTESKNVFRTAVPA